MKKTLLTLAVMATALVSCNRDETLPTDNTQDFESFKVIEELELTGEQLFSESFGALEGTISSEDFTRIGNAFTQAQGTETKSIVPALYKTARVEYMTTDQDFKPVKASALIVYPLFKKIDKVMLINHGTHVGFMLVPTKYTSVEAIMAATGSLCIMPDYIGLGSSASHPDLYLNHEVHGRTSIDALVTLFDYAKARRLPLASDYKSYILGYSQGGSVSLASLRELQRRDEATQKRINLEEVYCGDGPYDLRRTFETYVEEYENGKKMGMGAVIPLVINSMFNSYASELAGIRYEDFFTAKALRTGVPQAIRQNKEGIIDIMAKFLNWNLGDILNMDYLEQNPDHLAKLLELMDRQNLCNGWEPKYKLQLMHCNPDGVVPFSNFEKAYANLNNEYMQEPMIINLNTKLISEPILQHIAGMLVMMEDILLGEKIQ